MRTVKGLLNINKRVIVPPTQPEFFGKYLLLEKIASGGMAEVFMARAPGASGIGKIISMKRILPQYTDNQDFLDMFKSEAKIAINLKHSNVVSIYEFGVENEQLYLTMEYVEGKNLRQLLNTLKKKRKKLSIDQIIYIIKEVASGLDHAHRCIDGTTGKPLNIIHRDMSPQNVMTSFEGEIKIVDFGIAKAESQIEKTKAGTLKGKFGYMSPEQAQGLEVDIRTDIFSLGIVLWEMLAGERLFVANNEINTLRKIRDCNVPSIKKINPKIHPELERIVNKSLVKDRNLRYQYASEFYRDLNRFLNRQYPDFSKQDFSMFISGLYAEEIVGIRNRIVEYSKIPFKEDPKTENEKNEFLELITNTSPLSLDETMAISRNSSPSVSSKSTSRNFDFSNARLKSENPFYQKKYKSTNVTSTLQHKHTAHMRIEKKRTSIINLIFALVIFGGIYFVYQNGSMEGLLRSPAEFTKKMMDKHNIIKTEVTQAEDSIQPEVEVKPELPINKEKVKSMVKIVVNSKPSGAKIFINGNDTRRITPSQVSVPLNEPMKLVLRKRNYFDYKKDKFLVSSNSARSFNTTLQKANIGYVNIDVRPAKHAKIFINGKELVEDKLPIKNYAVQAGTTLVFKASNPFNKVVRYKKVVLKPGESKNIIFNLNSKRLPSSKNKRRRR